MSFKVQARQCDTCIYRKATGFNIKELEAQIRDPNMGFKSHRICHHSKDVCCRGFWNRHKDKFQAGQIAQRLGLVQFVDVDTLAKRRPDMEKIIVTLLTLMIFAAPCRAWEFKDNPDRFPSVGLNLSHGYVDGDHSTILNPHQDLSLPPMASFGGPANLDEHSYGVDVRLPLADWFTLGIGYDKLRLDEDFTRVTYPDTKGEPLFADSQRLTGDRLTISCRFYLK